MARSEAGRLLTEQHYQAQRRVRALALRDYLRLWPMWTGEEKSFRRLTEATIVLVRAYQQSSAQVGAAYFDAFRLAEDPGGSARSWLADPMTPAAEDKLVAALFETGVKSLNRSLEGGRPPGAAMEVAFTNTSGVVTDYVSDGGRGSVMRSTANDEKAKGWGRVTDADPCAFCALLSSRGPVYISEDTADFQAHGHCGCTAEPGYEGTEWPGRSREFHDMYNEAILLARQNGTMATGTSNDLLNTFRRHYDRQRSGK